MAVKFLSAEWAQELQERLNANPTFTQAIGTQSVKIQQVITGNTDGTSRYWLRLEGGRVELGVGEVQGPDATITQDYETAVALAKNELTGTAAYMSGKLKVSGDLMKLMQLQGTLAQLPAALKDLDVEY